MSRNGKTAMPRSMPFSPGSAASEAAVEVSRDPRIEMQVYSEYEWESIRGEGLTSNVSTSGALLEKASREVQNGTLLTVRFSLFLGSFAVAFPARVVRQIPDGFAVQFVELQSVHRGILGEVLPPWAFSRPG